MRNLWYYLRSEIPCLWRKATRQPQQQPCCSQKPQPGYTSQPEVNIVSDFELAHSFDSVNEVIVAVIPFRSTTRRPPYPEDKLVSVVVTIQLAGSSAFAGQALAESNEPSTRKWKVYNWPSWATNATLFN